MILFALALNNSAKRMSVERGVTLEEYKFDMPGLSDINLARNCMGYKV